MSGSASSALLKPEERVLSTLNADGSRRWITPRVARGRFWQARRVAAFALIAIFVTLPWITINGRPAVLLDIARREFSLLGRTFLPTDSLLLAFLGLSILVAIFLLTALLGRVWCGWACPQTVYMEFVFRPLERLFEGEPGRAKPSTYLGLRRVAKWGVYLALSLGLAHTFLSYFVGVEQLRAWVTSSPLNHPAAFVLMAGTTAAMMFDFCFFREQLCIVACPYGRFQSVMLDRHSLIVSYDPVRGEPRGKRRAEGAGSRTSGPAQASTHMPLVQLTQTPEHTCCGRCKGTSTGEPAGHDDGEAHTSERAHHGDHACAGHHADGAAACCGGRDHEPAPRTSDCVDCGLCVAVCPTGIDIRNGLQLECIGCAQCIDACDSVMTKLDRPAGLIRYSSQAAIARQPRRFVRPRVVVYPLVLTLFVGVFVALLMTARDADVSITRGRGMPFNILPSGLVTNQLAVKITNRSRVDSAYSIEVTDLPEARLVLSGATEHGGATLRAKPGEMVKETALIEVPASAFAAGRGVRDIALKVTDGRGLSVLQPFRLLGPAHETQPTRGAADAAGAPVQGARP